MRRLSASGPPVRLTTPPLAYKGNTLRPNVDTGSHGAASFDLRDADNRPIPGFTPAGCEEVGGNFIDHAAYWKGESDVSALAGKPVRVHFRLKRAKPYAFQFTKD